MFPQSGMLTTPTEGQRRLTAQKRTTTRRSKRSEEYIPIEDGRKLLIRLDDQQRVNAETIGKVERQRNKLRSRLIELGDDPDKLLADGGAD